MDKYTTFHKVLDYLQDFQVQSPILNTFSYGNLVDFGQIHISGGTVDYPFMFAVPQSIQYDENITTYNMTLIFADILNWDLSNEKDAVSDMSLQARRFLSYVKRGIHTFPELYDNFDINLPVQAIPFFERFGDHVAGVAMEVPIMVFEDLNACDYYEDVTPTPTVTATATVTPTVTATATPTPSVTSTLTPTPTITPSPINLFCVGSGFDQQSVGVNQYGGSIYVYGSFQFYQGSVAPWIVKINPTTGYIDNTFYSSFPNVSSFPTGIINTLEFTTTGKMYVGGAYNINSDYIYINRLNSDGSRDSGFTLIPSFNGTIYDLAVKNDDSAIFVGGTFTSPSNRIAKILPTGSIDPSFVVGTGFNGITYVVKLDSSNNVFVGGNYTTYQGTTRNRLVKINEFGAINTTFHTGFGTGFNSTVNDLVIDGNDLYVVGNFTTVNGVNSVRVAKLNATTGVPDGTFGTNVGTGIVSTGTINAISIMKNPVTGNLIITVNSIGTISYNGQVFYGRIFSIDTNGNFVSSFGSQSNPLYGFNDISVGSLTTTEEGLTLPSGEMIYVGPFNSFDNQFMSGIVRINSDGTLDSTSNCLPPVVSATPTPTSTPTVTPTKTVTPTPTVTPSAGLVLSFSITSGATKNDSCFGGATGVVYAQDLGNCGGCSPLTCWACLSTSQQLFKDILLTIPVNDAYYTNNMDGSGNFGTWLVVGGYPQGGGFSGGCP